MKVLLQSQGCPTKPAVIPAKAKNPKDIQFWILSFRGDDGTEVRG